MLGTGIDRIVTVALAGMLLLGTPAEAGTTQKIEAGAVGAAVEVTSDSAVVLESEESFSELVIANPKIADISTISGTTLYVLGKQPGRTTLMLIRDDGSVISVIDVQVSPDVTELSRRLSDVLPNETIEVLSANNGLVLSGTVNSQDAVNQAIEIAQHYAQGKVSNLMKVKAKPQAPKPVVAPKAPVVEEVAVMVDPKVVQDQIRAILPEEPISVHDLGGTLVLSGTVSSQERAQNALQIAKLVSEGAQVSNLLTIAEKQSCKVRTRRGGEMVETNIPCASSS